MRSGPLFLCLALIAGCESVPKVQRAGEWPYGPSSIRINPLSRVSVGPDGPVAIIHVEFEDVEGDQTKGMGILRIACGTGEGHAELEADLSNLAENAAAYQRATRTYRFEVSLPDAPSRPVEVRVELRDSAGVLADTFVCPVR